MLQIDRQSLEQTLASATPEIRTWLATNRDTDLTEAQVFAALCLWLESAVEEIALESFYHCCEGTASFAVGRSEFKRALHL